MEKLFALTLPGAGGQQIPIKPPSQVPTGGIETVGKMIQVGLSLLFITTILLTLFFIITAGIYWITSGGDKEKLSKARARITYAIIGLIVAFSAFFIVNLVGGFVGVDLLNINKPFECGIGPDC